MKFAKTKASRVRTQSVIWRQKQARKSPQNRLDLKLFTVNARNETIYSLLINCYVNNNDCIDIVATLEWFVVFIVPSNQF